MGSVHSCIKPRLEPNFEICNHYHRHRKSTISKHYLINELECMSGMEVHSSIAWLLFMVVNNATAFSLLTFPNTLGIRFSECHCPWKGPNRQYCSVGGDKQQMHRTSVVLPRKKGWIMKFTTYTAPLITKSLLSHIAFRGGGETTATNQDGPKLTLPLEKKTLIFSSHDDV